MATLHKLTTAVYERARRGDIRENRRHPDGGGLYLRTTETGAAGWVFRYQRNGRERLMGGGAVQAVSLREARAWAQEQRRVAARGHDPVDARRKARTAGETFWTVAERVLADIEAGSLSHKSKLEWRSTLTRFAKPTLGDSPVDAITRRDVLELLQPLWHDKHVTALRLRARIEAVFDAALAAETIDANPARWADLRGALGRYQHRKLAHKALDWRDVPAFVATLAARSDMAARALEFAILTAARAGEATGATWGEVPEGAAVWRIAPERMKARKPHAVPLAPQALAILADLRAMDRGPFVFFGRLRRSQPLRARELLRLMVELDRPETVHGFRSAFRSWAADHGYARELAEAALAHALGAVEASYQRSDTVEARRAMMAAWADWCCSAR